MASRLGKLALLLIATAGVDAASPAATAATASALSTCQAIGRSVSSSSSVIYAASLNFATDIKHWFVSSTQVPTCVLEAGSPADVAKALQIIAKNKTPFAVKSGGHASNPGFSSTTGVHIVFKGALSQVNVSPDKSTVEIGMGLTWAQVYTMLQSAELNVAGGRTPGPGVGGFSLGGGFSWKSNQFGLTCDNIRAFHVVLPNSTTARISSGSDLFFALKGGLNRFGIVTSIEYLTHPQPPTVYGGIVQYGPESTQAVLHATQAFYNSNTDPKAQIITTIDGGAQGTTALVLFFYDGPMRPTSFSPFNSITPLLSTVQSQTFSSFISSIPSTLAPNIRGTFNTISTSKLTPSFLAAVYNESVFYGTLMALQGATTVAYDIEPFLAYGRYATDSAYPHADSPLPLNIYFAWAGQENDAYWYNAIRASAAHLKQVAISEGIFPSDYTAYPNYAVHGTSSSELYGGTNAARLAQIRKRVDPDGVMELAGGFAI